MISDFMLSLGLTSYERVFLILGIYIYIVSMHGLLKKKLLYINQIILTVRNAF